MTPRLVTRGSVAVRYDAELDASLSQQWDPLVDAHPGADVTQLCGWGRLRRAAGYEPSYLLAHRGAHRCRRCRVRARHATSEQSVLLTHRKRPPATRH